MLGNQLLHGGATWNSQVNRNRVRDGASLLATLLPVFIDLMLDAPQRDWGAAVLPGRALKPASRGMTCFVMPKADNLGRSSSVEPCGEHLAIGITVQHRSLAYAFDETVTQLCIFSARIKSGLGLKGYTVNNVMILRRGRVYICDPKWCQIRVISAPRGC